MRPTSWTLTLLLLTKYVKSYDNALMILGGASKVFMTNQTQSPVSDTFELFGCSDGAPALPSFPASLFGTSLVWETTSQTIWACGGSNWQQPHGDCYTWNVR